MSPYEILRNSEGEIALSVNAGLLPKRPRFALDGRDLQVTGEGLNCIFDDLPEDALDAIQGDPCVLLFEMAPQGIQRIHEVCLSVA
ncbi:hypothetical protein GCM10028813_01010 [Ramlibacter alkalitolerans]